MRNVRRKRHLPQGVQNLLKYAVKGEFDDTVSVRQHFLDLTEQFPVSEAYPVTFAKPFAGLYESLPSAVGKAL